MELKEARIVDPGALRRKVWTERACRSCGRGEVGLDPHHLVYRSRGGDDLEANIVSLCRSCHRAFHDGSHFVRVKIRKSLTEAEEAYIVGKIGRDRMERLYPWE